MNIEGKTIGSVEQFQMYHRGPVVRASNIFRQIC